MDNDNLNRTTLDVPPPPAAANVATSSSKSSVVAVSSSLPTKFVQASGQGSTNQLVATGPNVQKKYIRKIIPLDPKKLQQAGLDRKIAEALSKQKSQQQSNTVTNQHFGPLPTKFNQLTSVVTKNLTPVSKPIQISPPAQDNQRLATNKLKPPKITVTGPEDQEKQNLANLNPQQRLVHVKNLLNKKLLQKKSKEINNDTKTNHLLPTHPQAITGGGGNNTGRNLTAKQRNEKPTITKYVYDVSTQQIALKNPTPQSLNDREAEIKLPAKPKTTPQNRIKTGAIKTLTPQKSPQDIARKLVFQAETPTKTRIPNEVRHKPEIERPSASTETKTNTGATATTAAATQFEVIPKASIAAVNTQQQYKKQDKKQDKKPRQYIKKSQQAANLPTSLAEKTSHSYQAAYMKAQDISIEPNKQAITNPERLDFPEVSPLKTQFPTVNVPQETPLPAIDSFKKPYPLAANTTNFYNYQENPPQANDYIQFTNYETSSLFNQQHPTTSSLISASNIVQNNTNKAAALVVLENKILSQDEMIDLTELRLTTQTPRFINPHRPIPEVVIKQENTDEYQTLEVALTKTSSEMQPTKKNEKSSRKFQNVNQTQRKIINAQKLKMPPEQLANLAKRIKEETDKIKETKQVVNKYQNTAVSPKTSLILPPQQPEIYNSTTTYITPQTLFLPDHQMYSNTIYNQQHQNYYDGHSYFVPRQTYNNETYNNTTYIIENSTTTYTTEAPQYNTYYNNFQETSTANFVGMENSLNAEDNTKSAVEIVDEPIETEDCFSAIDFIASLGGANADMSPEELNLSASCALPQQNYSPVKQTLIPQTTTTRQIIAQTNPSNSTNLRKSTIVIESSKGQETILTNESPDKNELERVKEKIKIYHEMNKQKTANPVLQQKVSPKKIEQMRSLPPAETNVPKLYDNTNVCEMDIEESKHEQHIYLSKQKRDQLTSNKIDIPNPKSPESLNQAVIIAKSPSKTKIKEKSMCELPAVTVLTGDQEANDVAEINKTLTLSSNANDLGQNVATPPEQITTKENLVNHKKIEEQSVNKLAGQKITEILTCAISNNEISGQLNTGTKLPPETENSFKSEDTVSNAGPPATKRISKFKKGKINLVTRNKPSVIADSNKVLESSNANKDELPDEEKTSEKKLDVKKKVYLEPRNKSLIEREQGKIAVNHLQKECDTKPDQDAPSLTNRALDINAQEVSSTQMIENENTISKLAKQSETQEQDKLAQSTGKENTEKETLEEEIPENKKPELEKPEKVEPEKKKLEKKLQEIQVVEKEIPEKKSPEKEIPDNMKNVKQKPEKEGQEKKVREKEMQEKQILDRERKNLEKDITENQMIEKDISEKKNPEKEIIEKETTEKKSKEKEIPEKKNPEKKNLEMKISEKKVPEKENPAREGPEKETQVKEFAENNIIVTEIPEKKKPEQQIVEKETPAKKIPEKDFTGKKNPERRTEETIPEKKKPEQQIVEKETPVKKIPEKGFTEKKNLERKTEETNQISQFPQKNLTVLKPEATKKLSSKDPSKNLDEIPKASIKTATTTSTTISKNMTLGKTTESLMKQTESKDVKVIDQSTNAKQEKKKSREVEKSSEMESKEESFVQQYPEVMQCNPQLSKAVDEIVENRLQNLRNCLVPIEPQTTINSNKFGSHELKENLADKSKQQSSPKAVEDNERKVTNDGLKLKGKQIEEFLPVSTKLEREEKIENVFGLPKALKGRMLVLQDPKKTIINEVSKWETSETREIKCFKASATTNTPIKSPPLETEQKMGSTKIFQPKLGLLKTSLRLANKTKVRNLEKSMELKDLLIEEMQLKKPKIEIIDVPEHNYETKDDYLNQQSQVALQKMKSATVSLIDIVKHCPTQLLNKPPILPFKKSPRDSKKRLTTNVPGVLTLSKHLREEPGNVNETEENSNETKKRRTEAKKSLLQKEEQNTVSTCSRRRPSSRNEEPLTPPLPPKITRKRLSFCPLITDDDLEFLPENAEIKFKLTKSKQKEDNKKSQQEILLKEDTPRRREESLYSSALTKRKRFYSQTLETNVTVTFDNLKSKNKTTSFANKESCHESSAYDSNVATPTKTRKKLRKTVEDIKKSQNALSGSDSDDLRRDYDCLGRDCEESNEFLGFEESASTTNNSCQAAAPSAGNVPYDTEHETKTKHGGLKNWLTTGKAISPTFDKATTKKRLRHDNQTANVKPTLPDVINIMPVTKLQSIPLKKRWELANSNSGYEETDITDDTSPADDEEDIPINTIRKSGIKSVINSNKNTTVESKKVKLGEHSFIKPHPAKVQNEETNSHENTEQTHLASKDNTLNVADPPKSKRGRKPKANPNTSEAKEGSSSEAELNKTTKIKKETNGEISCNISPQSSTINVKRKRASSKANDVAEIPTTQNESCGEEGASSSLEKHHSTTLFEDIDSNSLLTPLETSNITPLKNDKIEKVDDGKSLPATLHSENNGRGRYRRGGSLVSNFNSRLLLITKREQLDSEEILTEPNSGSGPLQCGLCLARTQASTWVSHLAQHYGVGWKVGEEIPKIDSRCTVLSTIGNFMKKYKNVSLACRMCQKVLRSALGLLTHVEQCGHQERAKCQFCEKDYSKSTLKIHLRNCLVRIAIEKQKNKNSEVKEEVVGNSGRLKRRSTIKAESKLKDLGKELANPAADTEKAEIDPKSHIKYVPQPTESDFTEKWSKEIENNGQASCPKLRCRFTSQNLNELSAHLKECKHIKTGHKCNFCRKVFKTEKEAINHILDKHCRRKSEDSDCSIKTDFEPSSDEAELPEDIDVDESTESCGPEEDDNLPETSKKAKNSKQPYYKNSLIEIKKQVFDGRFNNVAAEVTRRWNNFTQENHSSKPLYNEFTPQYSTLNYQDYERYLPTQTVSMKFNFATKAKLNAIVGQPQKDIEWSDVKRFETVNNNNHTFFFLGAPIKLCSWLPLPTDVNDQYLAVTYRRDMFKFTKYYQPKKHHSIVLLFKVKQVNKAPQLSIHYGIVVDDGPIHHITFLPSGGYDASSNRLGLMAVATVTSSIKVFSLPLQVDSESSSSSNGTQNITFIEMKPSFLLNLDVAQHNDEVGTTNPQCLQLCWSEFSGHQHIIAGFSNGFVGIWSIINNPEQNLNLFVIDNIVNYAPLNYFYMGEKNANYIALHYDTLGPRWLAVSAANRKFLLMDIKNLMNPIVLKDESLRNFLQALDWCPVWEPLLFGYDDVLPISGNGVIALSPNNIMFPHCKLDPATSGITQIHYTPLLNICTVALNNGDILLLDTKELHYDNCLTRRNSDRRAFYALDVKLLNGEPLRILPRGGSKQIDNVEIIKDWVMEDQNYKEKYGLMFTPLFKLEEKMRKVYLSEQRLPPPNVVPFMRVNTLRCNLNQQAKRLIAAGYENGFLRLFNIHKEKVFS